MTTQNTQTEISAEKIDKVIYALNQYGIDYDKREYGLPVDIMGENHMTTMRNLINEILNEK